MVLILSSLTYQYIVLSQTAGTVQIRTVPTAKQSLLAPICGFIYILYFPEQ